jgi:5-methylthioadenosine/S-adenosylhomocysteine deaminase
MRKYQFVEMFFFAIWMTAFLQSGAQTVTTTSAGTQKQGDPIVLIGTVILPQGTISQGYVAIVNGRIASISDKLPTLPKAVIVYTNGIILPGFVDVHNHVPFNILPRWKPGQVYTNRNQWRTDPEVLSKINGPMDRIEPANFCDMNRWGELRALVGGATSIMTTHAQPCINGLVRNLDLNSGFYGTTELDREHIFNVLDLPPASDPAARAAFVGAASFFIGHPFYEALFIHLAEGTDAASQEEFTFMQSQSLLNPKGVVIHGIPLGANDFQAMALNGTALVWSPRSNLELYGQTANINAAMDAGVEIALAPDWAITGSSNMLDELKVAAQWNCTQLNGRLTDRQLVEMVTSAPAHIAGVDDEVGAIAVGLRADILVINGDRINPYKTVVDATSANVDLVLINGVPIYGDRKLMKSFWDKSEMEEIKLNEAAKVLAAPAANIVVSQIETRLKAALQAEGVSLAPLVEADGFVLSPAATDCVARVVERQVENRAMTQGINNRKETTKKGKLTVTALPNPSRNYFTINTSGGSENPLQMRITDILGRNVEMQKKIASNTTFRIGNNLQPGVYFVEVMQGIERQLLKLIKQ